MVWFLGVGEKLFSLVWEDMIVVKCVGFFMIKLFELKEGDRFWIRGFYGYGFIKRGEKVVFVGGGIGILFLYVFVKKN